MKIDLLSKINIKEIFRFLVGGGTAVIVDAVAYALLKDVIGVSQSKAFSYVLGASVGFVINKLWTFESKKFKFAELIKYILLYVFSAFANTGCNSIVLWIFANETFAFLCATGTSTIINFLGQKFLVFRKEV